MAATVTAVWLTTPLLFILSGLTLAILCHHGNCTRVHITPDYGTSGCIDQPCFTLNDYIHQDSFVPFSSNTTVIFQAGRHQLNASEFIVIRDVSNLNITGMVPPVLAGNTTSSGSEILCVNKSGFYFLNVSGLTINNLILSECGVHLPEELTEESLRVQTNSFFNFYPLEQAAIVMANVFDLRVTGMVVLRSYGYGLLTFNVLGQSIIENSVFLLSNAYTLDIEPCILKSSAYPDRPRCAGGNVVLIFADTPECLNGSLPKYNLTMVDSYVAYGVNAPTLVSSGLAMALAQTSYEIYIDVNNLTFVGNTADVGANVGILTYESSVSSISIRNSLLMNGNPLTQRTALGINTNSTVRGGGLYYRHGRPPPPTFATTCPPQTLFDSERLLVYNTSFIRNNAEYGGGVRIRITSAMPPEFLDHIHFEYCNFLDNIGIPASALLLEEDANLHYVPSIQFIFKNCTFLRNVSPRLLPGTSVQKSQKELNNVVQFASVRDVTLVNCQFEENRGTSLAAYSSRIRLHGDLTFARNYALRGGGMALYGNSLLLFSPKTHVYLVDNHAEYKGGGIFVGGVNSLRSPCFFQVELRNYSQILDIDIPSANITPTSDVEDIPAELDIAVMLENNTALVAGSGVYGGAVNNCVSVSAVYYTALRDSGPVFDQLFHFNGNNSGDPSLVSSDASRVCICQKGVPHCHNHSHHIIGVHPGETFEIEAITYGQRDGVSPTVVYSTIVNNDSTSDEPLLVLVQSTQRVGRKCTPLSYTISSRPTSLQMVLSVEESESDDDSVFVDVELHPCPLGFVLMGDPPFCQCDSEITSRGLTCNIESQTVHRTPPYWISKDHTQHHNDEDNFVLVHRYCPLDYCTDDNVELHVNDSDEQCANSRSGTLCGGCQDGLSAVFGSSKCTKCSNEYLALILLFIIMGAALKLLICTNRCFLTTVGAINGLIFYANIVQFNRGIFFPNGDTNVLTVFIAWLNLDFGIPVCFYDGMDAYAVVWLQFVFPVYIWGIAIGIIVACHYSSTLSKLAGGNYAVPVLSTLLLVSFSKVLRTTIKAMSFTTIEHRDGSHTLVWLYDGNVEYLKGKHIPLFMAALFVLVFLTLPYVLLILLGPWLQALSGHRGLRWVNKLKPFLDAYQGPYKEKYRYWTGLLLVVRLAVFTVSAWNIENMGGILLAILIASQLLMVVAWYHGGVYKKWTLNVLEAFFFLNLGMLTAGIFYAHYEGKNEDAVVYTSVSACFLVFTGIIVYEVLSKMATWKNVSNPTELLTILRARVVRFRNRNTSMQQTECLKRTAPRHSSVSVMNPLSDSSLVQERQYMDSFTAPARIREPLDLIETNSNDFQ